MWLDINYRKKATKNTNTWRLNSTLLNNQEITEEIRGEIKKYLETNDNENTTTENLWDAAKAVLRGKFIAIQAYLKKKEIFEINNLNVHFKKLENEEQAKPKVSRRKEIIRIRAEINEIETLKNRKYQWNQELVLWKDKQNWQIFSQPLQEKNRESPKFLLIRRHNQKCLGTTALFHSFRISIVEMNLINFKNTTGY